MYVVFTSINWEETRSVMFNANWYYLSLACFLFVLSKVSSALRLNVYFRNIDLHLSEAYNIKMAWVGMFYNLFLPGGIGGDGYKVFVLDKAYKIGKRKLGAAVLIDRVSGMIALLFLGGLSFYLIGDLYFSKWLAVLALIGALISFPSLWVLKAVLFKTHRFKFFITTAYSITTQGLQVVATYCILLALGVEKQFIEYIVLFLASSVVAILPFTIGGIGARELTFILGSSWLLIDENVAVGFSLIFFLITAFTSFFGAFLSVKKEN